VTTPEIIDQIHEQIFEDRRISAKSIGEQLGISRERVWSIIHDDFNLRKISAKWFPLCLNADRKNVKVARRLSKFWNFFGAIQIISCLVAIGGHGRNPETKQQSMKWRHSGSPRP